MLCTGGWWDGWARFHSWNLSNPSAVQGRHYINRPSPFLAGSALWEDGGEGGRRSTLQPVPGNKLSVPECPGPLQEADQWDFPQWGHEDHVRLIKNFLLHCLVCSHGPGAIEVVTSREKIKTNVMSMWEHFQISIWCKEMRKKEEKMFFMESFECEKGRNCTLALPFINTFLKCGNWTTHTCLTWKKYFFVRNRTIITYSIFKLDLLFDYATSGKSRIWTLLTLGVFDKPHKDPSPHCLSIFTLKDLMFRGVSALFLKTTNRNSGATDVHASVWLAFSMVLLCSVI